MLVYTNGTCEMQSEKLTLTILGPKADFSALDTQRIYCFAPRKVDFKNKSIVPGTGTTSYAWTFYDNDNVSILGNSTEKEPSFTYNSNGSYKVMLIVSNTNGCKDTLVRKNYVQLGSPKVGFKLLDTLLCANSPLPLLLQNLTVPAIKYNFELNFINGTDTLKQKNITLPLEPNDSVGISPPKKPGIYSVSLIAKNNGGCADTLTQIDCLFLNGIELSINADPTSSCMAPLNSSFTSTIKNNFHYPDLSNELIYKWSKDEDDLFTMTPDFSNPDSANTLAYHATNTCYGALLKVSNSSGCSSKKIINTNVGLSGSICMINKGGCRTVFCKNTFYPLFFFSCRNDYSSKWWSEPPGVVFSNDTLQNPKVLFPDTVDYKLFIRITTPAPNSCIDTISANYTYDNYHARFYSPNLLNKCDSSLVSFYNTSTNAVSYQWAFGDSSSGVFNVSNDPITAHKYNINPLGYDVRLIITNPDGCKDTLIKKQYIKVLGPVSRVAVFNKSGCDSAIVTFRDSSIFYEKYLLSFGDTSVGASIAKTTRTHTYYFPKNAPPTQSYVVFHPISILTDSLECTVSKSLDSIVVYKSPVVKLTGDVAAGCIPLQIQFIDSSSIQGAVYS